MCVCACECECECACACVFVYERVKRLVSSLSMLKTFLGYVIGKK